MVAISAGRIIRVPDKKNAALVHAVVVWKQKLVCLVCIVNSRTRNKEDY